MDAIPPQDPPPVNTVLTELLRCIAQLTDGKSVEITGFDPEICAPALAGARMVCKLGELLGDEPHGEFVICVDPNLTEPFLQDPIVARRLHEGSIIATWCSNDRPLPSPTARYISHYLCRAVAGSIISDNRFPHCQVVALRDAAAGAVADFHLLLWSNSPLPTLPVGFFENSATLARLPPRQLPLSAKSPPRQDLHAIALVRRLLAVEDRTMDLRGENFRLKMQLAEQGGPVQQSGFDMPKTKQPWPLAERPDRLVPALGLYDRRPDDTVIQEAQRGSTFMEKYNLLSANPDYGGAVAALNQRKKAIQIDDTRPDSSIIIPVYGQLSYTLNCLDSLFNHISRFGVEIIIVDDCSPDGVTEIFVPLIVGVRYHKQDQNGGFIKSCNTGGQLARGNYVVMLNSDTRVVDGWLDELLGSFALFARAGLIGSKMLYPDGTLQEAGGILWRDGGAWNYGREDDPNRPQYCYARQVDYISGCSIAIPTELWRSLGGFDPHYTPAYCEDADLCQRIIARGLEVWFQPTSRVVHYEGKTSGTSTASGAKAYQVINLKKLFLRWRTKLETHRRNGEGPFFEKDRSVRKRILFVDAVTPTPNQDAGSVQTVLGIRCGQKCGYKAHFIPEDNWLFEPNYTPDLQREGVECAYAPFDVGFDNYIRRYGWLFDVVLVYRVGVMHKSIDLLHKYAPNALLLFHLADLHYLRMQRQAILEGSDSLMEAAEALKEKELATIRLSDCTITHSTVEAEILAEEAPGAPVTVWPLMIEVAGTKIGFEARRDICFLGGYRHPPNVDAVFHFVQNVLPLIHAVRPDIRFIVAGANPPPDILALASDTIIVTGMVDDLADVFDSVRVFVCPLRVGAGAKGKVMSALSYGLPIVSTSVGVEGAGLIDGQHMIVADDPAAMTEAVLRLYEDPVLWQALSTAGQILLRQEFSLDMGARKLEEAVEKAYRHRLGLVEA